jgi:hypothetical protein
MELGMFPMTLTVSLLWAGHQAEQTKNVQKFALSIKRGRKIIKLVRC